MSFFLFIILASCKKQVKEKSERNNISVDSLKTASFELKEYPVVYEFIGEVFIPEYNKAYISTPVEGIITKIVKNEGNYCKKGETIAILEHPSVIELQKKYLELKHKLEFAEKEFKRQGDLSLEYAVPLKKMQKSQAEYYVYKSQLDALFAQLEILGINPETLNHGIVKKLRINAPMSGYIDFFDVHLGEFVKPSNHLGHIIKLSGKRVKIELDPEDIELVNIKDTVLVSCGNYISKLKITNISKVANQGKISVLGVFIEKSEGFFSGFKVKIKKQTSDYFTAFTLPVFAVLKHKTENYILVFNNREVRKEQVKVLKILNDRVWVKPLHNIPEGTKVVIEGVDNFKNL